ncbi:MAG: hypothetical protein H5U40_05780, partial [Polyangiaceae bacterium]|nr:hypothetical protein [Polyangiaceae bacterium]
MRPPSPLPLVTLAFALSLGSASCGDDDGGAGGGAGGGDGGGTTLTPALRLELVSDLAKNVIVPAYDDFLVAAGELEIAATAYAADPSVENRNNARLAFDVAMAVWQRAEVMQVGPSGSSAATLGGQNIRDEIYSWPFVDRCRVDQELVEGAYANVDAFAGELVNVRGLDELEYLLYRDDEGHSCLTPLADWPPDGL